MREIDRHRKIYRTIVTAKCSGQHVVNGEFCDFYAELSGNYSVRGATRRLRRDFADDTIVINNIEVESRRYFMDLDTFVTNAKEI